MSAAAPKSVTLQDKIRRTQSGTLTIYEYITLTPATTVTLQSIPAMTFRFPATTPIAGKSFFYGLSNLNAQGGKVSFDTEGPGTISGWQRLAARLKGTSRRSPSRVAVPVGWSEPPT